MGSRSVTAEGASSAWWPTHRQARNVTAAHTGVGAALGAMISLMAVRGSDANWATKGAMIVLSTGVGGAAGFLRGRAEIVAQDSASKLVDSVRGLAKGSSDSSGVASSPESV